MAEEKKQKKWRLCSKSVGLTYSQSGDLSQQQLLDHLKTLGLLTNWYISKEEHKDGGKHLHAWVQYAAKIDTEDVRYFDLGLLHPNILKPRENKNWINYVIKFGNFICGEEFDMSTSKNYLKRKQDYNAWQNDLKLRQGLQMEEIKLKDWQDEALTELKKEPVRRRILWIWSYDSGTGKTTFKDYCFNKFKVLVVNDEEMKDIVYAYDDHQVIWFDITRADRIDDKLYKKLEKLSDNGPILSTKYMSTQKFIKAHIVVTSNEAPPFNNVPNRIVEIKATL